MSNPCIECGKERINGKTWTTKAATFAITHTLTICPDPACQKIVDKAIAERLEKNARLLKERVAAKQAREKLLASNRT